jgi:ketosteroid isomerase-like protein
MQMRTAFALKCGDVALLRGEWTLKGTGPDGAAIEMSGKNVEVARRQSDSTWRFAIDHPFGAS